MSSTESKPARRCVMILAAGQGTRMKSALPKVLHPLAGVPMVAYAIETARALVGPAGLVVLVVGHGRAQVEAAVTARFGADAVRFAVQTEQRGTADAVRAGLCAVPDDVSEVVITYGDAPRVPLEALAALCEARERTGATLALVTAKVRDATGYGRIVHDAAGRVVAIREHRDCSPEERAITVFNPGLYALDRAFLAAELGAIGDGNAQGERYLTDLVAIAARDASAGVAELRWDDEPLHGVNDRAELAATERAVFEALARAHGKRGVTVAPGALLERDVTVGEDCYVGPHAVLRGRTTLGRGVRVDAGCVVEDSALEAGAVLKPYCVVVQSRVGEGAQLGPFAHLRPKSDVGAGAHVGNYVELKNTTMAPGAKANHLAYLGDGVVGAGANIGAGTIFCNYDGYAKHTTEVGEGAFVGSNSTLVAPVKIGAGAYVGAGSVVTREVPDDALALGRARQETKEGYAAKLRALKKRDAKK